MERSEKFLAAFCFIGALQMIPASGYKIVADETFQVLIKRSGEKVCGGTAISNNEIITAASCLLSGNTHDIEVISFCSTEHSCGGPQKVVDKCRPKNFENSSKNHANDIIVLRLQESIKLVDGNSRFSPIQLAEKNLTLRAGSVIKVTAYELDQDHRPTIVEAIVTKTSRRRCRENYSDIGGPTDDQFCAHRRETDSTSSIHQNFKSGFGACDGDKGISATVGNKLVGLITNWKANCTTNLGLPVIFTSIAHHRDFIDECLAMFTQKEKNLLYAAPRREKDYSFFEWLSAGRRETTFWDNAGKVLGGVYR